ncbi:MAG: hypothetical protein U0531_00210 [Dehalococcoidia bacterium]
MIATHREYQGTREAARELEDALADAEASAQTREPLWQHMLCRSIESMLYERYAEIGDYEARHPNSAESGAQDARVDIGRSLMRARILADIPHEDLARRLGMNEVELLALEASRFAGATLEPAERIADALGVRLQVAFTRR